MKNIKPEFSEHFINVLLKSLENEDKRRNNIFKKIDLLLYSSGGLTCFFLIIGLLPKLKDFMTSFTIIGTIYSFILLILLLVSGFIFFLVLRKKQKILSDGYMYISYSKSEICDFSNKYEDLLKLKTRYVEDLFECLESNKKLNDKNENAIERSELYKLFFSS